MNLDTIAPPARLASDELVPSRYALQVGDIDVLMVSDGVITPPAETMATNVDPSGRPGRTTCSSRGTRSIGG